LNWAKANLPNFSVFNQVNQSSNQATSSLSVSIIQPASGSFINNTINLQAEIKSDQPISKIIILFNNQPAKEFDGNFGTDYTLNYNFVPNIINLQNSLKIQAQDETGNQNENQVIIYKSNP
jgi:hypothetical protein